MLWTSSNANSVVSGQYGRGEGVPTFQTALQIGGRQWPSSPIAPGYHAPTRHRARAPRLGLDLHRGIRAATTRAGLLQNGGISSQLDPQRHRRNPNVRTGSYRVLDTTHVSTKGLPARFSREDEFYNFKSIDPAIHVLVEIDETSYEGGTNGAHHPMSWYHDFDGGRAWYTNMGHTEATYTEPLFLRHLLGGLRYAIGTGHVDFNRARP